MGAQELFQCPPDLTLVGDGELADLQTAARAEFDRVHSADDLTPELLAYATTLTDDLDKINAELRVREVRAELAAQQKKDSAAGTMAKLAERVHGPAEPAAPAAAQDAEAIAAAAAQGTVRGLVQVFGDRMAPEAGRRIASLSATAERAPAPAVPAQRQMLAVTASIDVPKRDVRAGGTIPDLAALADAFIDRAGSIPATAMGNSAPRYPVASIKNEFSHVVDDRTGPADIERLHREMTGGDKADALLAGGGWCAPSEIRYDFFNIADAPSGMIDLPTVGVSRGGIRYPVSPSIKDVFFTAGSSSTASGMGGFAFAFSNASDPWLWSETDDILTVTGAVNKPTLRVPCASFNETRLEAYGLALTAGNLTDSAYPEQTANFLRLLRAAYAHAINARLISLMVNASAVAVSIGGSNYAAFNTLMSGVELAAVDYRNRYGMADGAVLEVVLPIFARSIIRADLAYRVYGDGSLLSVTDQQIDGYFADRGVRVQFVSDWQVRGSGQFGQPAAQLTAWPTSVKFMIYAAGTFLHGTGLTLDLGVIRDSVLNAENDFSAAWAEEAHLIAMVGHESRVYTATIGVNGAGVQGQTLGSYI